MDSDTTRSLGFALQLGFNLVAPLLLFIGGGVLLDNWLRTAPLFILIGVLLGLVGVGYVLYDMVRKLPASRPSRKRPAKPD